MWLMQGILYLFASLLIGFANVAVALLMRVLDYII